MGLLQTSPMDEHGTCHPEVLSGPTSTPLYLPKIFPFAARPKVPLPEPLGGTLRKDCGLYTGPTMLGQKGKSAYTTLTMPLGGVCPGTTEDGGTVHFIF